MTKDGNEYSLAVNVLAPFLLTSMLLPNVKAAGLGDTPLDLTADDDPRHALVDWLSQPANKFFAHTLVNRYWKHFFSRGLVEPDCRLIMAIHLVKSSRRMFRYTGQGFVDRELVFQGDIIGVLV